MIADAVKPPPRQMLPAAMREEEYAKLRQLIRDSRPSNVLEIGMANGGSSVCILQTLRQLGEGHLTSIDPFQTSADAWHGNGLAAVSAAGLEDCHTLIENFDYFALPRLVSDGTRFDFILIDGWHSFDYTLVDIFYSDLLLRDGGILAVHDTGWPAVYKACKFLETHKPYRRIGPAIAVHYDRLFPKLCRRISQVARGKHSMREAQRRRTEWFSLGAYEKIQSTQTPDAFFASF